MLAIDGKVMRVDLSKKEVAFESCDRYEEWIGGQGVNQSILFNELPLGITPYEPGNIITIGTGALVGTSAPGASRTNVDTLNPFTGGIASSSAGGYFGRELRFAGINNIIIKGMADRLVYLLVENGDVRIVEASHLRMKKISETAALLRKEHGEESRSLLIGPAGEKRARAAGIMVDEARSAARCGVGGVMGSKNLKGIVVKGTGMVEPVNPSRFDEVVKRCLKKLTSSSFAKGARRYGVYRQEPWDVESPYRNFSGEIPTLEKKRSVLPDAFLPFLIGTKSCGACPIGCWKVHRVWEDGKPVLSEALQIASIHNFAAKLDLFDPETILKAHALCNDLGLDEDNASGTIAWAFECYEKGALTRQQTGGLELHWGNREAVFELLENMAYRRGFGDVLAEGCREASKRLPGTEEYCITVKGQELSEVMWDCPAWALGTVVSARGGTHTRGAVKAERFKDIPESVCRSLFGVPSVGDKSSYEYKERLVVFFEKFQALSSSLGMCYFMHGLCAADLLLPEDYADLYSAATGKKTDGEEMMFMGERIFTLEKCFNVLHTEWTREEDLPPKHFISRPLDGKTKIDVKAWNRMLDRYYELHGWDKETGKPLRETLDRLNLGTLEKKLEATGKLP